MSKSRAEVNAHFHGPVDIGSGVSADYVVAHAERQKQRGKNPTIAYRGVLEPRAALQVAQADIEAREHVYINGRELPYYLADFSGRVAVVHARNDDHQVDYASEFVDARMRDGRCVGAMILRDLEQIDLLSMPDTRANPDGTTDVLYTYG